MNNQKKEITAGEQKSLTPIIQEQSLDDKPYDIDAFLETRKEFIEKVNAIMVEGKDYHIIQNKKSLAKGGAEKIASIFNWQADFKKDTDVTEAFSEVKGLIAFVCDLKKGDKFVGQGRGASTLAKNSSDPNKTIKMAQKSAFIDAVLRASGLSDFFTQDLEDMPAKAPVKTTIAPKTYRPRGVAPKLDFGKNAAKNKYESYKLHINTCTDLAELKGIGDLISMDADVTENMSKELRMLYLAKLKELGK